jgi:MFS family permease
MPETQPEKTAESTATKTSTTWMPTRRFFTAVIAIAGMQLMATMDGTIAIVALPKIQNELSLSDAGRSWVITAYVLTFGGLMLLGGRLGDTIGRKRTFIVGVTLFTIASALCGIAWDDVTLVIARLLQGVGAAIASPTGFALVATTFAKGPARNAATAVFGAMTGVVAVGVSGERPDRAGDDLAGPHRAAGDQP